MGLAFAVLMPTAALIIRHGNSMEWYITTQMISYLLALIGSGLGIWMSMASGQLYTFYHPKLGMIMLILLLPQPLIGSPQRQQNLPHGMRTFLQSWHIWCGRLMILIGFVNGPLGIVLSHFGTDQENRAPERFLDAFEFVYIFYSAVFLTMYLISLTKGLAQRVWQPSSGLGGSASESDVKLEHIQAPEVYAGADRDNIRLSGIPIAVPAPNPA